jgi:hypothetical protein
MSATLGGQSGYEAGIGRRPVLAPAGLPLGRGTGWALIAFGGIGLAILALTAVVAASSLAPLAESAAALESQRAQALALLGPAADSLESAATSADHAGGSLVASESSARDAATVTGQLADALGSLAGFSSSFDEVARQSRSLSESLTRTADSLHQNQIDSASVGLSLHMLARQLTDLRISLGGADTGSAAPSTQSTPNGASAGLLIALATGLLLWLAAMAIGSMWLGRRILLAART